MLQRVIMILIVLACASIASAQDKPHAFVGARIIPIAGDEIPNGVLIVQDGKIVNITPAEIQLPSGAIVHDVSGKVIMPGLVDTHSHIGSASAGDGSAALQPDVDVMDGINVRDDGFQKARAGGITTVNIMPGSGHLLSGKTIYLKLRPGKIIDDLFIKTADGTPAGGMKMANGTNSIRTAPFPGTRAKSAAMV